MAKQVGPLKFEGSLGNISFYKMLGDYYARRKGGGSKATIKRRSSCEPIRESNREFSAASAVSKLLRNACGGAMMAFGDTYLTARLTGQLKKMCDLGEGVKGKRTLSLSQHGGRLKGFDVNDNVALGVVFSLYHTVEVTALENNLCVSVPSFSADNGIQPPSGATHFRFTCFAVVVGDYVFSDVNQMYEFTHMEWNGLGVVRQSILLSANTLVPDLVFDFEFNSAVFTSSDMAVIVCLGVTFFQHVNGVDVLMKQGKAMRVIGVVYDLP